MADDEESKHALRLEALEVFIALSEEGEPCCDSVHARYPDLSDDQIVQALLDRIAYIGPLTGDELAKHRRWVENVWQVTSYSADADDAPDQIRASLCA